MRFSSKPWGCDFFLLLYVVVSSGKIAAGDIFKVCTDCVISIVYNELSVEVDFSIISII